MTHASEVKESIRFEHMQRAEIASLRKYDQSENLQRRLSFERVGKERLAD